VPPRPPIHRPPWLKPREQLERERKAILDRKRPNSGQRGYDRAWQGLRARFIVVHPFCCAPGCTKPTHDVDHVIARGAAIMLVAAGHVALPATSVL
jgi:5-methylcytosine-specific restriction protein A